MNVFPQSKKELTQRHQMCIYFIEEVTHALVVILLKKNMEDLIKISISMILDTTR